MSSGTPPYDSPPPPPPPPPPGGSSGGPYGGGPYGGGPYGPGSPGPKPDNHLVWAILSTVLCCMPLGSSIVFASQVDSKWAAGDYAGAREASEKAKKFAIISAGVVAAAAVLFIVFVVIGSLVSLNNGPDS